MVKSKTGIRTFPKSAKELVEKYGYSTIRESYTSVNPSNRGDAETVLDSSVPGVMSPEFPENEDQLMLRMNTTLERIVCFHGYEKADEDVRKVDSCNSNIVIVSHAPCIQALAFNIMKRIANGKDDDEVSKQMKPWPLGS